MTGGSGDPLSGEPAPTLEPTVLDHSATGAGAHAGSVPVLALPASDVGLVSAFHVSRAGRGGNRRGVYSADPSTRQWAGLDRHHAKTPRRSRNNAKWPTPRQEAKNAKMNLSPIRLNPIHSKENSPSGVLGRHRVAEDLALLPPAFAVPYTRRRSQRPSLLPRGLRSRAPAPEAARNAKIGSPQPVDRYVDRVVQEA